MIGTSLVVQWLRISFPRQGTWVRFLIWELHTTRQLSLHAETTGPTDSRDQPQIERSLCLNEWSYVMQLRLNAGK